MLYLVHGQNKHFKEQFLVKLKKQYKNYTSYSFDASDSSFVLENLDNALNVQSFFDTESKFIYLRSFSSIQPIEYVYEQMKRHKNDAQLIFVLSIDESLRSNAKIRAYVDVGYIIEAKAYTGYELEDIVKKKLVESNIPQYTTLAKQILKLVENDPYTLENETEKLILFFMQIHKLPTDIIELITPTAKVTIWEYLDYSMRGKRQEALSCLNQLIEKGENEFGILGMIAWNMNLLVAVKSGEEKTDLQIAKDFGYALFSIKQMRLIINGFSYAKLIRIYDKITELELRIKNGMIEPRLGLLLLSFTF